MKRAASSKGRGRRPGKPKGGTPLCVLSKTAAPPQDASVMTDGSPTTAAERASAPGANAAVRVAIVEDQEWMRESLVGQIQGSAQFTCVGRCSTGEEALAALPACRPDVVLMDINLPGMSGIECVRRLKESLPDTNVLMLTVYEEGEKIFDSLKAGASGYLLKRAPEGELMDAIAQVHAGGSPMTGLIARKVVQFFGRLGNAVPELEKLSPREREILELLSEGASYKEIAGNLALSIHTIRMHIRGIYRKLHVHSRGEVVAKYMRR
jgi:DNA-binding NarL/FixJ family response regulator